MDIKVIGISVWKKKEIKYMKERGVEDGNIINIKRIDGKLKNLEGIRM